MTISNIDDKKQNDVEEIEEIDIPNNISFSYNGSKFTLAFDRDSAAKAEKLYGLSYSEVSSGKSSVVYDLFAAAFIKHHPHVKATVVLNLWDDMSDKQTLYNKLVYMYLNTASSVFSEAEEGKAISWVAA